MNDLRYNGATVQLPIDVVPHTHPPKFRWQQSVSTMDGVRTVDCEGPLPPAVEGAVGRLVVLAKQLQKENEELQKQLVSNQRAEDAYDAHTRGAGGSATETPVGASYTVKPERTDAARGSTPPLSSSIKKGKG